MGRPAADITWQSRETSELSIPKFPWMDQQKTSQISHLANPKVTLKNFSCEVCQKRFGRRIDLARHSLIHTGEKPYKCDVCANSFNRKSTLTKHKKTHGLQVGEIFSVNTNLLL